NLRLFNERLDERNMEKNGVPNEAGLWEAEQEIKEDEEDCYESRNENIAVVLEECPRCNDALGKRRHRRIKLHEECCNFWKNEPRSSNSHHNRKNENEGGVRKRRAHTGTECSLFLVLDCGNFKVCGKTA